MGQLQWWRRLRGGKWSRVSGLLWGRKWVHVPITCVEHVEEDWLRGDWHRPLDWWIDGPWTRLYCRCSFFHVMRSRQDGSFIIVYQRKGEPKVPGYFIDSSAITPLGCKRIMRGSRFWDALMKGIGPEGARAIIQHKPVRGKQEPPQRFIGEGP